MSTMITEEMFILTPLSAFRQRECLCVCVCVRERERERERGGGGGEERKGEERGKAIKFNLKGI